MFVLHDVSLIKITAKTEDEDPAGYKRWICYKRDLISQILRIHTSLLQVYSVTPVNLKKAGMTSGNIVMKKQYTLF